MAGEVREAAELPLVEPALLMEMEEAAAGRLL
jgi:hypothetical protein